MPLHHRSISRTLTHSLSKSQSLTSQSQSQLAAQFPPTTHRTHWRRTPPCRCSRLSATAAFLTNSRPLVHQARTDDVRPPPPHQSPSPPVHISTMATTVSCISKESWLRSFMDKYSLKEDGSNFQDWEINLRLAAQGDGKEQFLVQPSPQTPGEKASEAVTKAYEVYQRESSTIKNVLIFSIAPALQRRMIHFSSYQIFVKLTNMFSKKPRILAYDAAVRFFEARLIKGQPVGPHVLKMIEYVETLEQLGSPIPEQIAVDRILHSLHEGYANFRVNFNMNDLRKSLHELHAFLVQALRDMVASGSTRKDILSVDKKTKGKFKKVPVKGKRVAPVKGKGKTKVVGEPKPKKGAQPDQKCFHCDGFGHWKRNCPKYLKEIKSGAEGCSTAKTG